MNGGKDGSDGVGDDGGVGKGCAEDSMVKMVVRVLLTLHIMGSNFTYLSWGGWIPPPPVKWL